MNGRIVVVGGWRGYLLAGVALALVLAVGVAVGLLAVAALLVGGAASLTARIARAIGLGRPDRRLTPPAGVIEGKYRVVERQARLAERID